MRVMGRRPRHEVDQRKNMPIGHAGEKGSYGGSMLAAIGRMIWVPVAFIISGLVSGFLLLTLGMERVTQVMHGQGPDGDTFAAMFELLGQTHLLLSGLTVIPAFLVVLVGELGRIRSSLYYIIGGGVALAIVPLLARLGQSGLDQTILPVTAVWQVFATAGFLGGWVYWLLCGRRA